MAGLQTLDKGNPEALHDIGQSKAPMVGEKFVNPGTPEAALVSYDQLTQTKIRGNGSEVMRTNIIK
ncbi:hypothetical protein [Alistipes putredinis]|jgi:hypothetical protein|uniref:hypothetical protein n=1 Tax=Alistipes putredinis TaxID=28117 RepID=UPI003AB29431